MEGGGKGRRGERKRRERGGKKRRRREGVLADITSQQLLTAAFYRCAALISLLAECGKHRWWRSLEYVGYCLL